MIRFFKKLFASSHLHISSSGRTDIGRVREHNEDNYCIRKERQIFIVADGMGGHNAGEVASRVAIDTLDDYLSKMAIHKIRGNRGEIRHFLIKGFHHTNSVVMKMAQEDESRHGMGCTMINCLIDGDILHTCHVGDARCYIADDQGIEQLTTDHSVIAAYKEKIPFGNTANLKAPPRQVITRAIGFPFPEDPEYHYREIQHGNRVLLCSDGLWSMLDDKKIHNTLITAGTASQASDILVRESNEAGGTDNITAVVIFC